MNNPLPLILNPPNPLIKKPPDLVPTCNRREVLLLGAWGGFRIGGGDYVSISMHIFTQICVYLYMHACDMHVNGSMFEFIYRWMGILYIYMYICITFCVYVDDKKWCSELVLSHDSAKNAQMWNTCRLCSDSCLEYTVLDGCCRVYIGLHKASCEGIEPLL